VSHAPSTAERQMRTLFIIMTMDEHYTKISLAATFAWNSWISHGQRSWRRCWGWWCTTDP
jgi:hypothetical protein